jgi:hypothetical protein
MDTLAQLKAAQEIICCLLNTAELPSEVADAFGAANRAIASHFQELQRQQLMEEYGNKKRSLD